MPKGPIQCQKVLLFLKKCKKKYQKCKKIAKNNMSINTKRCYENISKAKIRYNNRKYLKVQSYICWPQYVQSRPKFTVGNLGQFTMSHMSWIWQIHYKVTISYRLGQTQTTMSWNSLEWLEMVKNESKWLRMAPTGPNMAAKGSKLLNIAQNCFKLL